MTKLIALTVLSVLAAGCAMAPASDPPRRDAAVAQRQILLTVAQANSAAGLLGAPSKRYLRRRAYGPTPSVERTLNQLATEYDIQRIEGWPIPSLNVYCEVFEIPAGVTVEEAIARLTDDSRIDLVQRMNLFETLLDKYNDPYIDFQSAVVQLDVEQAHELATGKDVLVAVIDSAVDDSHPDLRGRIGINRDLVDSPRYRRQGEVHGTAIAGVIASAVNNREGIIGVAPDVTIAALRACWPMAADSSAAQCSSFSLAQALQMALSLQPEIINLSLAGPFDPLLSRLLDEAIRQGIVVVAADPELDGQARGFPASHSNVIAAHSISSKGHEASRYLLAAPGREIITTTPDSGYSFLSGNSLAAAHVSGVIALLMERDSGLSTDEIARLLADTTVQSPVGESINACRALETLAQSRVCGSRD